MSSLLEIFVYGLVWTIFIVFAFLAFSLSVMVAVITCLTQKINRGQDWSRDFLAGSRWCRARE